MQAYFPLRLYRQLVRNHAKLSDMSAEFRNAKSDEPESTKGLAMSGSEVLINFFTCFIYFFIILFYFIQRGCFKARISIL